MRLLQNPLPIFKVCHQLLPDQYSPSNEEVLQEDRCNPIASVWIFLKLSPIPSVHGLNVVVPVQEPPNMAAHALKRYNRHIYFP